MSRTILIHLNVEAADDDPRTTKEILDVVLGAVEVGLEGAPGALRYGGEVESHALVVVAPLCEEV